MPEIKQRKKNVIIDFLAENLNFFALKKVFSYKSRPLKVWQKSQVQHSKALEGFMNTFMQVRNIRAGISNRT